MAEKTRPAVVFDLDGTLLDSIADIAACANRALETWSLPAHTTDAYRGFVGWGAENLIRKAMLPATDEALYAAVRGEYDRLYQERCDAGGRLFGGVEELLQALHRRGVVVTVCSNKPQPQTAAVCASSFGPLLDGCMGQRDGLPIKPDPTGVQLLMEELHTHCIAYVGDSDVDIATGCNLGVPTIGVSWGMQPRERLTQAGADVIADSMEELATLLLDQAKKSFASI